MKTKFLLVMAGFALVSASSCLQGISSHDKYRVRLGSKTTNTLEIEVKVFASESEWSKYVDERTSTLVKWGPKVIDDVAKAVKGANALVPGAAGFVGTVGGLGLQPEIAVPAGIVATLTGAMVVPVNKLTDLIADLQKSLFEKATYKKYELWNDHVKPGKINDGFKTNAETLYFVFLQHGSLKHGNWDGILAQGTIKTHPPTNETNIGLTLIEGQPKDGIPQYKAKVTLFKDKAGLQKFVG